MRPRRWEGQTRRTPSAGDGRAAGGLGDGGRCERLQRNGAKHTHDLILSAYPCPVHLALTTAGAVLGPQHALVERYRPVDRLDYVTQRDLGGGARQGKAAVRSTSRHGEAGVHQALEDLGEEALGDVLRPADLV